MEKNLVDIVTLGCSKNLVDTEYLLKQFEVLGYNVRHDAPKPDGEVVIVNTCGFINDAKEESVQTILQLAELRKRGKIDKLYVMGCLSERYLHELEEEIPEVDRYFGKFNYTDVLMELGKTFRADFRLERTLTTPPHYAYVKISEGCDRTCSYCAIPLITGRHRSRPLDDIEHEVRLLARQGVKEFQLVAQDLSYYGIDLYKSLQLPRLVERLADIPGVEWLRLHYAYPTHFPFEVLRVMRERDNVCKYLDIALQHISDRMLQLMRRNITKEQTYDLLRRIREEVPGIHLRTTLLMGHPGETEDDVEEAKQFLRDMRFERMGAFAFSNEEGTYAHSHYQDDLPEEVKEERVAQVMEVQQRISSELNQAKIGKQFKVMIDRREGDYYVGRTEFDSPEVDPEVLLPLSVEGIQVGEFYHATVTAADDFDLFAR